ncbi:MAG: ABC transporter ATP-binding protein [Bacteroidia bacterium]
MNIELVDICKSFATPEGSVRVFKNLDLTINSGEFVSILGPNGCGKTTLFNLIIGLDKEYSGYVKLDHISDRKTIIAYMMQKDLLLPWKTVYQNILIGLDIQSKVNSDTKAHVTQYLERFGILNLIDSYPSKLSGGERQKVALIRTLMLDSEIMLLDEPFSAIDYNTRLELQAQIHLLAKENNKTILLITHDIDEAITVSDRAIIFKNKPNGIFKDLEITFDVQKRSPISVKQDPKFAAYFSEIWQSLSKQDER